MGWWCQPCMGGHAVSLLLPPWCQQQDPVPSRYQLRVTPAFMPGQQLSTCAFGLWTHVPKSSS